MKIQCNVCELAEANVLCCADEAALCWSCDEKVHAANKLVTKHQRVLLSSTSSSHMPNCDICQETVGYFFCLEDRALLCRKCDVSIHTVNNYVSAHQRFLLTGIKVGLEPAKPGLSSSSGRSHLGEKAPERDSRSLSSTTDAISLNGMRLDPGCPPTLNTLVSSNGQYSETPLAQVSSGGSATGSIPQWHLEEFLGLNDFNQNYSDMNNDLSKVDTGKLGESDGSPILKAAEEEVDCDDLLGKVPDAPWAVPQIPSPPTASGLCWPRTYQNLSNSAVFVPNINYSPSQNLHHNQLNGPSLKRLRHI